ncbi:hypothetical protein AB835_04830 [Candidatus Endobugula sertula]|uniref:Uncharacterized protein n=1 Tax=Candidatus Endobugula sertula TaxID=62101 RepID=A0A1D2QRH7_9GAMM|nr:hypothetical protein AB835_04830 [Candidatus Endobugula sertula]
MVEPFSKKKHLLSFIIKKHHHIHSAKAPINADSNQKDKIKPSFFRWSVYFNTEWKEITMNKKPSDTI